MKRILFLLFLFFAGSSTYSQAPIIVSNKAKKGDMPKERLDMAEIRCLYEFSQKAKKGNETIVLADTMMLEIGNTYSYYYNWSQIRQDSVYQSRLPQPTQIQSISVLKDEQAFMNATSGGVGEFIETPDKRETARIYKNRMKHEVVVVDEDAAEYFKCTETIIPEWEIREDTLTVMNYLCQKAVASFRGRDYTVWFTMDVPINEGPWKLYGLPGLILKAEDDENVFEFRAIGIDRLKEPKEIILEQAQYVSCNSKQLENIRQKRLSQKMTWYINGGIITIGGLSNPIKYNAQEK